MIQLRAGAVTDVGRARRVNQDMPLVADDHQLWAVADGMGGHRGGEVAAGLAIEALAATYAASDHTVDGLLDAATAANTAVNDAAEDNPDLRGMGTTLVALAHTEDDEIAHVSVGDSRIYLLRDGDLSQLTIDHSLVGELLREGSITPEEARVNPKRNMITRAIGIDAVVQVDSGTVSPYTGDRFLLCSDGLFSEVEEDRIASVLRRLGDPSDAAAELVRLANEGGGRDNITVVVVDVTDDGGKSEAASALVSPTGTSSVDDLAGFTIGLDEDGATTAEPKKDKPPKVKGPRRFTWRVALFALVVLAILGAGAAAIGYYARGTYYVGFDGDVVTVFQGKPGGVLWFEPTVVEHTEFTRADVRPELRDELDAGVEIGDRARALAFPVSITTTTTTTTTTTATTTTSTTTTLPPPTVTP